MAPTKKALKFWENAMKKVADYLRHAEECRAMAAQSSNPDHQAKLAEMVKTWEMLAETRKAALAKKKILSDLDRDDSSDA